MDRKNYYNRFCNKLYVCIYSIGVIFSGQVYAQSAPSNTNIAGPSASATGNVTNQAVQVLQGPYAVNTYGAGVSCQGPTLSVAPFVVGNTNSSLDPDTYRSGSANAGISLGFNFPLDTSLNDICKARAKIEIERQKAEADKARLDFELIRSLKCLEIIKSGGFFHPDSSYGKICADIVGPAPNGYLMTGNGKIISKIKTQSQEVIE
jgi:hypothetical protein